jgi:hypothetical protein
MSTVTTFFPAEERNRRGVKREKEKKKKKSLRGKTCSSRGPADAAAGCSGVCASVNIR